MMNYRETKKFQSYVMKECDNILSDISNILSVENISKVHDILSNNLEFRAFCNKIIPSKIGNITLESFEVDFNKGLSVQDTISNSFIKKIKLSLFYDNNKFSIEVKTNKRFDDKTAFKYDTKYNILGYLNDNSYEDTKYDCRYFPVTLSRNPYNIYFMNDDCGLISTIEYINYYDFSEFSIDYNEWNEDNFLLQKLRI